MVRTFACVILIMALVFSTVFLEASATVSDEAVTYEIQGDFVIIDYNATDALYILQGAVGKGVTKRPGMPHWGHNLNMDRSTDAVDAMLCLQHAVGKIVVKLPVDILYME